MHTFVDRLDRFLGDHHNEVVLALALVVLAEAVIIWLWARRAATLRRRLDAAGAAAGNAATHAAAALAVHGLPLSARELRTPALEPAAPAPAAPPAWAPAALAAPPGARVTVLLVGGDANVAKLSRRLLESRGYIVRHAADGVEGLEAARRERPDLILLDVMMPRMNGISFLQALREDATLGAV